MITVIILVISIKILLKMAGTLKRSVVVILLFHLIGWVNLAYAQGIHITSGGNVKVVGSASIVINNGGLINDGTYTKGTETVTFSGNTAYTISGSNTDMYNISVTNTGGITTQVGLLTLNNLTIASGCQMAVDPAKAATVNGTISNSAGNSGFILKSDVNGTASLLHNTSSVPATVDRYITGAAEAWHFLSTPVAAQAISGSWIPSGTYGNGTGYDLYVWDEATHCWIYKLNTTSTVNWNTVHPGSDFVAGRGYLYSVQAANPTKEFAGNLNNGTVSYGLTIGGDSVSLTGFNLVGNPYPSSVDWASASGWTRSMLTVSGTGYDMWIWNPAAENYGVYNSTDGDGAGTNSVTRYIAPMQGFFVRAVSAGNLSMTNSVRVHDGASAWKSTSGSPERVGVIVVSEKDKTFDEVRLDLGYQENQAGAVKLFSHIATAPSLFLPTGNEYCTVRYLTDTASNPRIPIMFKCGGDGNYTLRFNFDPDHFNRVMLEDRKIHFLQNLKIEGSYNFDGSIADDPNRFVLHFGPYQNSSDQELPARIYTDGSRLNIDLLLIPEESEVMVYDVVGRQLLQKKLGGKTFHNLNLNANPQMLMVYVKNPNGSLCRKIFWGGN
jgi:hypothetical protein